MLKKSLALLLALLSSTVLACPGCAGSIENPKTKYVVYILMTFIALTYIPFFIIYRMIYKNREGISLSETRPKSYRESVSLKK